MSIYIIGIVFFIRFMVKNAIQDVNTFYKPFQENAKGNFLDDINFSEAKYALYINHQELGEFMVTDTNALIENQNALQVKTSWVNYLPGEGNRSFGVMLFKDKQLIKQKNGGIFDQFEIGTLKDYGLPVKRNRFEDVKQAVRDKSVELTTQESCFIIHQSDLPESDKEFHFRVYFPSVAVQVIRELDSNGYERIKSVFGAEIDRISPEFENPKYAEDRIGLVSYEDWISEKAAMYDKYWNKHLTDCVREKAGAIQDFNLSISSGSLSDAFMVDRSGDHNYLRDQTGSLLYLKDFIFINYTAYIGASKADAELLKKLDFTDCMNAFNRGKPELIAKMKERVLESTKPDLSVKKGEVGLEGYRDVLKKSKRLYEQEYSISWFEIKN